MWIKKVIRVLIIRIISREKMDNKEGIDSYNMEKVVGKRLISTIPLIITTIGKPPIEVKLN